jgi:DNA repair exonuclease SbcCD ATPase subunit
VRIIEFKITNFLGLAEAHVGLDNKGLVAIQGVNNDDPSTKSNGAAKSSLAEAILWIIYGSTAKGLTGDDVVNYVAGKDCFGQLTLETESGVRYLIERWRKKDYRGRKDGLALTNLSTGTDLTKGKTSLTQEEVVRVVGCPEEVFTKAIYAGQEALPDLPRMTDRELKSLIEEAGGITVLERAYDIARERLRDAKGELQTKLREHEHAQSRLANAQAALMNVETKQAEWDSNQLPRIESARSEAAAQLAKAKALAQDLKALDDLKLEDAIGEVDARLASVSSADETIRALAATVSARSVDVARLETQLAAATREAKRLRMEHDEIASRIGTLCGECGKEYCEGDLAVAKKTAAVNVRKAVELARPIQAATDAAKAELEAAQNAHADASSRRTDTRPLLDERRTLTERVSERERTRAALDAQKAHTRSKAERVEELKREVNPYSAIRSDALARVAAEAAAEHVAAEAVAIARHQCAVANSVVEVYSPRGYRAHVLDTITPYLNERTGIYLGTLSDGMIEAMWQTITESKSGDLKENFQIVVKKHGAGQSFAALSGGERRKVRLACAFALQDLVASRASNPIRLWIGDEIDDALDSAGLERLMTILETKAREKGTVLVISHNDVRDWIRETATVTMTGGRATVTGALNI